MNRLLCATALFWVAGCGLIDSDVTDFDLRLPEKAVTIDTEQWMLTDSATMPDVPCAQMMSVCSLGVDDFCGAGDETCFATCDGQSCEVTVLVALSNEFDLKRQVPELQDIDEQPLASITIDRAFYTVSENTFNVMSPELQVYLAPQGVMQPGSPQAEQIGTIVPIPAGVTIEEQDVELTVEGRNRLRDYMKAYATPFNLIVGSTVLLEPGDPIPTGRLVATIKVDAHASPGL